MNRIRDYSPFSVMRSALVVIGTLIALVVYHQATFHKPTIMIQRGGPQSPSETISLPYEDSGVSLPSKVAMYTISIRKGLVGVRSALVKPDDCVRRVVVNNVDLPLPGGNRCFGPVPVEVFLEPYLASGLNTVVLTVENTGGPYGLRLTYVPETLVVVGYLLIVAAGAYVAHLQRVPSGHALVFVMIAIPYFLYWLPYYGNRGPSNDLQGHIGYIQHMSKDWAHPYAYTGRERWHPPTYYSIAGPVYRFGAWLGMDPLTSVRLLSLGLFSVFSAYAVATLRLVSQATAALSFKVAVSLLVFFPTSVLMATRISNDIALYAAWSASFFYLVRWYQRLSATDLRNVLIATAVAISVKSNAAIVVGMVAVVAIVVFLERRVSIRSLYSSPVAIGVGCLILGGVINVGRLLFADTPIGQASALHFGESGRDSPTLFHYVSMDVSELTQRPFRAGGIDPGFWPYVVRTMTFGEYQWRYPGFATILVVGVFILLVSTALVTAARIVADRSSARRDAPLLIGFIIPVLGLGLFHYVKRWSVCQDFRFIYPVIVPLSALYMHALTTLWTNKAFRPLYWCLLLNGVVVAGGAVVFYLGQYLYS